MTAPIEKTVSLVKEKSVSLAHSVSGKRQYQDEEAILDGWLHRETSVQGSPDVPTQQGFFRNYIQLTIHVCFRPRTDQ